MNRTKIYCTLLLSVILFSCQSIKKSFESKNYDSVIEQFLKLKNFDDQELSMFEKSYNDALDNDKEKIINLKNINKLL